MFKFIFTYSYHKSTPLYWNILLPLLIVLSLFTPMVFAVTAYPGLVEAVQPDGTVIKIQAKGDEFYNWTEDINGYTIIHDKSSKSWVYASQLPNGDIIGTKNLVGKINPNLLGIPKSLKNTNHYQLAITNKSLRHSGQNFLKNLLKTKSLQKASTPIAVNNLVLLVEFSDLYFTINDPKQSFDDLYNKIGYNVNAAAGSIKDYYLATTYNKVEITSTITDVIRLDKAHAFYSMNNADISGKGPRQMVLEAITELNATGFDFTPYDQDSDGSVDLITVIHAGPGQEFNDPTLIDTIWSHMWVIETPFNTHDGKVIFAYNTAPELIDKTFTSQKITRIGVVAHELGHVLGLPDLYDTSYATNGVGQFCLMASGNWNGAGIRPALLSAWSKSYIGVANPVSLPTTGSITIGNSASLDNAYYKFSGVGWDSKEYILIENRNGSGFDSALPGVKRGMLIYHINENMANNNWTPYPIVRVIEAVGNDLKNNINTGSDRQYFRADNNNSITNSTNPNSKSYSGLLSDKSITSISEPSNTMTFKVNFEAVTSFVLAGRINAGTTGQIVDGITVQAQCGSESFSTITATDGQYIINVPSGVNCLITPTSIPGYLYSPATLVVPNITSNISNLNFTLIIPRSVSGKLSSEVGIGNVSVNGRRVVAECDGIYSKFYSNITNSDGSYTISKIPDGSSCTISPEFSTDYSSTSLRINSIDTDMIDQNFILTAKYNITGKILTPITKLANGIMIDAECSDSIKYTGITVGTSIGANYTIRGIPLGESCIVRPRPISGYSYTFEFLSADNISANVSLADFILEADEATAIFYPISGQILINEIPIENVNIRISYLDDIINLQTDANGKFSYNGISGHTYNITLSKNGYTFNPNSIAIANLSAPVVISTVATAIAIEPETSTGIELIPAASGKGYIECSSDTVKLKIKNAKPSDINMKIFTNRDGRLVKEQTISNTSSGDIILEWDCLTSNGDKLNSGVYQIMITGGGISDQRLRVGITR